MIIDTFALLAIVLGEDDSGAYLDALLEAPDGRMSVANWLEATMVVEGRGNSIAADRLDTSLSRRR